MKKLKYILFIAGIIFFYSCLKQKFFPDPNDPNLSKFTSRKFLTGTCYINNNAYINRWSQPVFGSGVSVNPTLTKTVSQNEDSISFSWQLKLRKGDSTRYHRKYYRITFRMPVSENFTSNDLKSWNEKIFRNTALYLSVTDSFRILRGTGNLYFVKLKQGDSTEFLISGLFNGQIGDSIFIKKGRFDYLVKTSGF